VVQKLGGNNKFAERCGLAPTTIVDYRQGSDPSRANLIRMAKAAGMALETLATGKPTPESHGAFVPVRDAILTDGAARGALPWQCGRVRLFIDEETVRATFRGASTKNLVMLSCTDSAMQPRIYRDEWVIVDAIEDNIDDGMFALVIAGKFKIRFLANLKDDGEVRVHDCRSRVRGRNYSREDFRRKITIVGKVVISGRYPDIP
jgi:transcriptional regulator with XRE-family HTH domain